MRQRLLLSLLSILALVYLALPHLPIHGATAAVTFSWVWLGFCFVAFGGNFSAYLYDSRKQRYHRRTKRGTTSQDQQYERGTGI